MSTDDLDDLDAEFPTPAPAPVYKPAPPAPPAAPTGPPPFLSMMNLDLVRQAIGRCEPGDPKLAELQAAEREIVAAWEAVSPSAKPAAPPMKPKGPPGVIGGAPMSREERAAERQARAERSEEFSRRNPGRI